MTLECQDELSRMELSEDVDEVTDNTRHMSKNVAASNDHVDENHGDDKKEEKPAGGMEEELVECKGIWKKDGTLAFPDGFEIIKCKGWAIATYTKIMEDDDGTITTSNVTNTDLPANLTNKDDAKEEESSTCSCCCQLSEGLSD